MSNLRNAYVAVSNLGVQCPYNRPTLPPFYPNESIRDMNELARYVGLVKHYILIYSDIFYKPAYHVMPGA